MNVLRVSAALIAIGLVIALGGCKSSVDRSDLSNSEGMFLDALSDVLWDEEKILKAGYVACDAWQETLNTDGRAQLNVEYLLGNLGAGDSSQKKIPDAANRYLCPNRRDKAREAFNSYSGTRGIPDDDYYPPEFDNPPEYDYYR